MTEQLHQLVYYSRNSLIGSPDEIAEAIAGILAVSRRNNAGVGVSGALMFNAGCFAQVLEGERDIVEQTFERIQRDERHRETLLMGFAPVSRRAFESWSMAFVGAGQAEAARYGGIARESGFDPSRMTGAVLLETLHRLVLEEETAG